MKNYKDLKIYYGCAKGGKPNIKKQWFVEWKHWHPVEEKYTRQRAWGGINRSHTITERTQEARRLLNYLEEELSKGWSPIKAVAPLEIDNSAMGFAEAMKWACEKHISKVRKPTQAQYRYHLKLLLNVAQNSGFEFLPLSDIKRKHIKYIVEQLPKSTYSVKRKGVDTIKTHNLDNRSINKFVGSLKVFFNILMEWDKTEFNPCIGIKKLDPPERKLFQIITAEERKLIEQYVSKVNPGFFTFVSLIRHIGIRRSEGCGLKASYVDFKNRTIIIPSALAKNGKTRILPMPESIYKLLKEHLKGMSTGIPDTVKRFVIAKNPDIIHMGYPIFSENFLPGATAVHPDTASHVWNRLVKTDLGINKEMYGLKHTGASLYIDSGANPTSVQKLLGHSSLEVTQGYAGGAMANAANKDIIDHSDVEF